MPSFSILLPVYNGARYLAQAIESVLSQTYADFELLIADDCSSDATTQIVADFSLKDARIVCWRNPHNLGLFGNYNACLERAKGEYIKPFAQDDLLLPNALSIFASELRGNQQATLVGCARQIIDESGKVIEVMRAFDSNMWSEPNAVMEANLLSLQNKIGEPSAVAFKRIDAGSGFDESFYHLGDLDYWLRLAKQGGYQYVNEAVCQFRQHGESTTLKNAKSLRFALDMILLGRKYDEELKRLDVAQERFARLVADASSSHLKFLVRNNNVSIADVLSFDPGSKNLESDLAGFKALAFYSLIANAERLEEIYALKREQEFERNKLEDYLAKLMTSRSWKLTSPLRDALKRVRN